MTFKLFLWLVFGEAMLQKRIFQSDDRLVLHVGYQKAATKFLQGQIFDNLRGHVCYASGARKKEGSDEIRRLLRAVRSLDEINYEKFIASFELDPFPIRQSHRIQFRACAFLGRRSAGGGEAPLTFI